MLESKNAAGQVSILGYISGPMRGLDFPLEWPTLHNNASVFLIFSIQEGTYSQEDEPGAHQCQFRPMRALDSPLEWHTFHNHASSFRTVGSLWSTKF